MTGPRQGASGGFARTSALLAGSLLMLLAACAPAFALDLGQLAPAATTTTDAALSDPALADAISAARASQLAWQAMRETPTAKASRERSRSQFQGLSDPEALEAMRDTYPRLLAEPLWAPPKLGPGEEITGFSDDLTAEVRGPDGLDANIHSATPIRSSLGTGAPALVDIDLSQSTTGGFEPANPLEAYQLPPHLGDPVSFGDGSLAVGFPDAEPVAAQPVEEKLAYLNAWTDTDLVLAPLPEGFSTTQVLRSPQSPESFAVDLDLPPGAELRDVGGANDPAGAVVELAGGEGRLSITSPIASDADGASVATSLRVTDADSLAVGIEHRNADLRYPLQLDPTYAFCHGGCANYWNEWASYANSPNPGNWGFHSGDFYGTYGLLTWPRYSTSNPDWYGLTESGNWEWQGAYFRNENLYRYYSGATRGNGKNVLAIHGVLDPPNGRWITGVASVSGGTTGDYDTQSPWSPAGSFGYHYGDNVDHCFIGEPRNFCTSTGAEHHPDLTGRRPAMTAMWVDGTRYAEQGAVFMAYAYAYTVPDWQVPPLPTPPHDTQIDSGPPSPTSSTSAAFAFSAKSPTGGSALPGTRFECQLDSSSWQNCTSPKTYTGMSDGTHNFQVRAVDVADQRDPTPAAYNWVVDTTPRVTLSGTLKEAADAGGVLVDSDYELNVSATDSNSGVTNISTSVDGTVQDFVDQGCSGGGCSLHRQWIFPTGDFPAGQHTVHVTARNAAGKARTLNMSVTTSPPERDEGAEDDASASSSTAANSAEAGLPDEELEPEARTRWPDTFAGLWEEEGGVIFVGFTQDAVPNVEELRQDFPDVGPLVPVTLPRSYNELEVLLDQMTEDREASEGGGGPFSLPEQYDLGIDVTQNTVFAVVDRFDTSSPLAFTSRYGSAVQVRRGPLAEPSECTRANCKYGLRAGLRIESPNGATCSSGFVVRTSSGNKQLLSAGHCGANTGLNRFHGGERYGSVAAEVLPGSVDAERHSIESPFGGQGTMLIDGMERARDVSESLTWSRTRVGKKVCKTGYRTGKTCGKLISKKYRPSFASGGNWIQAKFCSRGGDSGGAVYKGSKAVGIISARSKGVPCSDPDSYTVVSPIEYVESALNVTVVTP